MSTTYKLMTIALGTLAILLLRWAVYHTFQLALIFAVVTTIAVVAGPAVAKGAATVRKLGKREAPKGLPQVDDVDWSAAVLNYKLPTERKDA